MYLLSIVAYFLILSHLCLVGPVRFMSSDHIIGGRSPLKFATRSSFSTSGNLAQCEASSNFMNFIYSITSVTPVGTFPQKYEQNWPCWSSVCNVYSVYPFKQMYNNFYILFQYKCIIFQFYVGIAVLFPIKLISPDVDTLCTMYSKVYHKNLKRTIK